jgi:hypothetical protein
MRQTATINTKIWSNARFRVISDEVKLLYFYVLTHPNLSDLGTLPGEVMRDTTDLGWPTKTFYTVINYSMQLIRYDKVGDFLWLPDYFLHNPVTSVKSMEDWESTQMNLPRCPLKHRVMLEASLVVKQFSNDLQDALPDSFKAVCANRHVLIIG